MKIILFINYKIKNNNLLDMCINIIILASACKFYTISLTNFNHL